MTYGDPDIGGRPPRYQNWNAGFQRAVTKTITVGATYAGSRGDFLGGAGRGFFSNQLDPQYLVLGNLLTQQATPANLAAAQAIVPGIGLPYPNFSGTISQMLRPFPQYSGVTDVYGNVAWSNYNSLQLTRRETPIGRWVDGELQLHLQQDRRQPRRAHRIQLRSGLGRRCERSAACVECHGRVLRAVRLRPANRAAETPSSAPSSGTGRSRASRSSGPDVRWGRLGPRATCRTRGRATRISTRPSQGRRA